MKKLSVAIIYLLDQIPSPTPACSSVFFQISIQIPPELFNGQLVQLGRRLVKLAPIIRLRAVPTGDQPAKMNTSIERGRQASQSIKIIFRAALNIFFRRADVIVREAHRVQVARRCQHMVHAFPLLGRRDLVRHLSPVAMEKERLCL